MKVGAGRSHATVLLATVWAGRIQNNLVGRCPGQLADEFPKQKPAGEKVVAGRRCVPLSLGP